MKIRIAVMVLALAWLGSGCLSIHNIERQQRLHKTKQGNAIRASVLNDGAPAIGYDLSAWDAMKTNKLAAIGNGLGDAAIAGLTIWGGSELLKGAGGGGSKQKSGGIPANMHGTTYIQNNTGSVHYNYTDSTGNPKPAASGSSSTPGITDSTIIINNHGTVEYNSSRTPPYQALP